MKPLADDNICKWLAVSTESYHPAVTQYFQELKDPFFFNNGD
ncbi:MAG: hypothetical protein ACXW1W_05990 [Methylococcaceae bacterium]